LGSRNPIERRALQFGLVLCFPVWSRALPFRPHKFLRNRVFSAFSCRPDPCLHLLFQLIPEPFLQILNLFGPLTEHSNFFLSENIHLEILAGAPEPMAGRH
jgi:hypothetical protein